ncbi:MAG: D-galactarate dehydratase [Pseudomonadota bacterium]
MDRSAARGAAQAEALDLHGSGVRFTVTIMRAVYLIPVLTLAACTDPAWQLVPSQDAAAIDAAAAAPVETLDPTPPPPPAARTVEEFDTTTAEDRAAAVEAAAAPVATSSLLGTTNVSLGSPADPGIWLKTGLVSALQEGRVVYPANGSAVTLELRPSGTDSSAGSEMSLAAMRLLNIPLTALADVEVYSE